MGNRWRQLRYAVVTTGLMIVTSPLVCGADGKVMLPVEAGRTIDVSQVSDEVESTSGMHTRQWCGEDRGMLVVEEKSAVGERSVPQQPIRKEEVKGATIEGNQITAKPGYSLTILPDGSIGVLDRDSSLRSQWNCFCGGPYHVGRCKGVGCGPNCMICTPWPGDECKGDAEHPNSGGFCMVCDNSKPNCPKSDSASSNQAPLPPLSTPSIDLVPVNPQPSFPYCPAFASDGKSFIVTVFNNNRTTAAPPTVTRLQLIKQGVDFYNLTRPTPGMAPGTSVNVSFPFPTTNVPTGDWIPTVTVDAGNQVPESNESNNVMAGRCIR